MFLHRLASLLGRTIDELLNSISDRELNGWRSYWIAEPWGPWRDNYHAAFITAELLRPHLKDFERPSLNRFMYTDPRAIKRAKLAKIHAFMEAGARKTERAKRNPPRKRK
jgi:hypothetical protein